MLCGIEDGEWGAKPSRNLCGAWPPSFSTDSILSEKGERLVKDAFVARVFPVDAPDRTESDIPRSAKPHFVRTARLLSRDCG